MSLQQRVRKLRHVECVKHLTHCWSRWHAIVMRLGMKRKHEKIQEEEFRKIRQDVLDACVECEKKLGAHLAPYFIQIRERVEPWLKPKTILKAERGVRGDLMTQSKRVMDTLNPKRLSKRQVATGLTIAACAAGAVALVELVDWTAVEEFRPSRWVYSVRAFVNSTKSSRKMVAVLVAIGVFLGGFVLLRSTRST